MDEQELLDDEDDFLETVLEGYGGNAELGGKEGLCALGGTGGGGKGLLC